ncbi:hypothetical protein O6H91_02G003600 [Diphasiastrum complanatum]|uniref:Uncharacterized protein n=1 Tax=Diphasiastrum complanatum TaxID=34168 RepID=A0ACC2ECA8_DIPCM|nr:hypothetical protein O6H91_02G003600 [Diphasiastrum complanatum]
MGGSMGKDQSQEAQESSQKEALNSTLNAVQESAGIEPKEAIHIPRDNNWFRVHEGDTLWSLSEKHLGDPTQWRELQSACNLGSDPLVLLPGSQITEACVARARKMSRRK